MKKITFTIMAIIATLAITSCSCYYGEVSDRSEMPKELPVGTIIKSTTVLFGSLEDFVDDPKVHYIYIRHFQAAKKRYVLEQYTIPAGTVFIVKGFRKARNPICFYQELSVTLSPEKPFSSSGADVEISLDKILDESLFKIQKIVKQS
jgi:hypothetical protein